MSIATDATTEQLVAELRKIDGKAEIVDGKIVRMSRRGGDQHGPDTGFAAVSKPLLSS